VSSRDWPGPPNPATTLNLVGDVHWGANAAAGTTTHTGRGAKMSVDMHLAMVADEVAAHVQLGDFTNDGLVGQDAGVVPWYAGLSDKPKLQVIGNHDIWGNVRTPAAAAAAYGMPAPSYSFDLGFATIVSIAPDNLVGGRMNYSETTIDWVDAQCQAAGNPVLLASHAPMHETIAANDDTTQYRSTDTSFFFQVNSANAAYEASDDASIRQVIADHPNVKAWLSGHTHTPIPEPKLTTVEVMGGRNVAHINASSIHYVGHGGDYWYGWGNIPIQTLYLTMVDEDRLELRVRDHGAGVWGAFTGVEKVKVIEL
jgi:hypothetical protein